MGAPKQKWTEEEEDALKAGVVKHGSGKWRAILKDPEFSGVLCLRSNVDLKDKWRNMGVITNGSGSRDRGKVAPKKILPNPRRDDHAAQGIVYEDFDGEIVDAKPLSTSDELRRFTGPSRSISRLENLILEAITTLKEPTGSDKTTIAMCIEDQYWSPPNFKELLSTTLKFMTASGKLNKVNGAYKISPSSGFSENKGSKLRTMTGDGKRKELLRAERTDVAAAKTMQGDPRSTKPRIMNAQEAAAAAARAVSEAEIAMAEAEEAVREAEAAEAEAEEAQAFARAAMMTLRNRNSGSLIS